MEKKFKKSEWRAMRVVAEASLNFPVIRADEEGTLWQWKDSGFRVTARQVTGVSAAQLAELARPELSLDALRVEVEDRTFEMVRSERDNLLKKNAAMRNFIREVPALIASARLDAKAGMETIYDYDRAAELCKEI